MRGGGTVACWLALSLWVHAGDAASLEDPAQTLIVLAAPALWASGFDDTFAFGTYLTPAER